MYTQDVSIEPGLCGRVGIRIREEVDYKDASHIKYIYLKFQVFF